MINKKLLHNIIKNYGVCLFHELNRKMSDWESMFEKTVNGNTTTYHIQDLESLEENTSRKTWKINQTILELKQKKLDMIISTIREFHNTITLAYVFENHSFWYRCFFDSRGRVYYHTYGPSPQNGAVSRALVCLKQTNNLDNKDSNINVKNYVFFQSFYKAILLEI